jgi:hypothetical protein
MGTNCLFNLPGPTDTVYGTCVPFVGVVGGGRDAEGGRRTTPPRRFGRCHSLDKLDMTIRGDDSLKQVCHPELAERSLVGGSSGDAVVQQPLLFGA